MLVKFWKRGRGGSRGITWASCGERMRLPPPKSLAMLEYILQRGVIIFTQSQDMAPCNLHLVKISTWKRVFGWGLSTLVRSVLGGVSPPSSTCASNDLSKLTGWFFFPFSFLPSLSSAAFLENTKAIVVVILSSLALCTLVAIAIYLYKRQWISEQRAFESARYSRTSSNPSESAEKNILVSDMELNEQQD